MNHDFFSRAEADPDRVVLTMANASLPYRAGAVAGRARRIAQWLAAQGLQAGDSFAVLLENRVEILETVLAARLAGLYAAVLGTHLAPPEVVYIVKDSGARLVVASARTLPQIEPVLHELGVPCWTVDEHSATAQVPAFHAAVQSAPVDTNADAVDFSERPLGRDLLYSSGTTGRPKGIRKPMLPAMYRTQPDPEAQGTARHMQMGEDTVYLSPAPLYHAAPLRYTLRVLDLGGQAVIMERFDAERALALIERHRVTHSQWVPTMLSRMLQLPPDVRAQHDLSSHRIAIHAAAPCPVPLKQAMLDWWGDILLEYYAGSEGCGTTLINSREWRERPGSVGRAITGQLHIVGDDGRELPHGEVGQIYFANGGEFSYLNDDEKNRQAFNAQGWATYGDIGHVDEAGYLYLSDRRTDLILSGGVNLYPLEIENALASHPAVWEVAVVGVPHADLGEQPLAVVVLRHGAAATQEAARGIVAHSGAVLSRGKQPQRLVFVDSLPRLETGKLLRRVLKERYATDPAPGFAVRGQLAAHG